MPSKGTDGPGVFIGALLLVTIAEAVLELAGRPKSVFPLVSFTQDHGQPMSWVLLLVVPSEKWVTVYQTSLL